MVLRHSYKVELQRLRMTMKALELDLLKNPENQRAKDAINDTLKEIAWYEERIKNGEDPGVHII